MTKRDESPAVPSATLGEGSESLSWARRDVESVWHGFTQMSTYLDNSPVIVESAEGRELIDVDGRRYFDAIGSLWVNTLGHRVPELDEALIDQVGKIAHSTLLGNGNKATIEFAEALAELVPMDRAKFLFASDGAAAVEQAIKIAFQYWNNLGVDGKTKFLTLGDAYHGDTVGSLSVGDGGFGTELFDPMRFDVLRSPGYADPDFAEAAIGVIENRSAELAAVLLEPIVQGAAGIVTCDPMALEAIGKACTDNDVLLICDEVAVGFGRTGTMFASEQCGLTPDLMALGKGITGGYLPMAATAANQTVYDAFLGEDLGPKTFYHGHSYSGHPLSAAVGKRHLELIDEWDVLTNVANIDSHLRSRRTEIMALAGVSDVRGMGAMCGIELAPPADGMRWGRKVSAECVRRSMLVRPLGDVIVLVPPLTSTSDEIDKLLDVVIESITLVCS